MAFDPDEYLAQAEPKAPAPAKGFDPDEYLAAQPAATPLPRARPEEAPSMTPAVEQPMLPRERPTEAPARPDAEAAMASPLYEFGAEMARSVKGGASSFNSGRYILQHTLGTREVDTEDLAKRLEEENKPKPGKSVSVVEGEKALAESTGKSWAGLPEALGTYATHPRMAAVHAAQSLPSMIPTMATTPLGMVAGSVAGPGGLAAGARAGVALGSGLGDFGDAYKDYANDKWKPKTAADWKEILENPEKHKEAALYAAKHAGVVGAFDALGMKWGGAVGQKIVGDKLGKGAASIAAKGVAGAPVGAVVGGAGEAGGEMLGHGSLAIDPAAVAGEVAGGLVLDTAGTTVEAATQSAQREAAAKGGVGGTTPGATVTEADIAAQVAAGGIAVAPEPGSAAAPIPTATPVTTVDGGVKTTTTVHGPAGAYTVGADPVTAGPTLKPAVDPAAWMDEVSVQADTLYPSATPGAPSPQAIAYENGAHGYAVHMGLPLDVPIDTVMGPYAEGQQFAAQQGPQAMAAERSEGRESVPVEGLYSRVRRWAETAPAKLPANEWAAKLRNNNAFKAEEVQDLYLDTYLEGRKGQHVTREELLNHIDAMRAPLVEVTRTPLTREEQQAHLDGLNAQIRAIAAADPTARTPEGGINLNHPLIAPLAMEAVNVDQMPGWAKYEKYTTPGPRDSYTELTLHLPARGATVKPENVALGQVKMVGEDTYGYHYAEPNEVTTVRLTQRTGINGERIAVLEEGQADVLQALKAGAEVGEMPYKEGWHGLAVTRFLMWAAKNGITHIAWADSAEQMRRYPQGTEAQVAARKRGMEHFYDKKIMGVMKRWARDLGGTISTTMIPATQYEVRPIGMKVVAVDPITTVATEVPLFGVFAPNSARPLLQTTDQVAAEEYAQRNTAHTTLPSMTLPQSALDTINAGMPSYSREDFTSASEGASIGTQPTANPLTKEAIAPLVKAINSLIRKLSLGITAKVIVHDGTIAYQERDANGQLVWVRSHGDLGLIRYLGPLNKQGKLAALDGVEIHVNVGAHRSAMGIWATMTHEVGHAVMYTTFKNTSNKVQTAVFAAYQEYYKKTHPDMTMEELLRMQSNAAFLVDRMIQNKGRVSETLLRELTPEKVAYWTGFNEWFAEQVAKWATTSDAPLSHVEKFFKGIAEKLKLMLKVASDMFGMQYEPNSELKAFLDSFLTSDIAKKMGPHIATEVTQATTVKNNTQMEPEDTPVAAQPETAAGSDGVNGVFDGRPPKEAQQAKAYADKFNWMWKTFTGIHQLAAANPHIRALADYVDTIRAASQVKQQIKIRSEEVLRKWNRLGETQADAVAKLLDEVQYMTYLTPDEKKAKVARHPTQAEVLVLAQKHGVSKAGIGVFSEVHKSFQEFLSRLEDVLKRDAMKMSDTIQRDLKLAGITKHMAALRAKPYFPSMRFGSYTLTIRDTAKKVIHFETFETERQRRSAMRAIQASYGVPDGQMQIGFLDKTARPLLGVPTQLLEMMGEKLKLNDIQKDQLEQLKFELSPAESFRHRFQHKKLVAGYSMDFRRAYAKYFFHGANHLMKAQYADRLRALTKMAKAEVANEPDITKRQKITAYMTSHTDAWLDPKPDWAAFSGVAFHFHLGWSVAAASLNLSQTLATSHPFLSSKFGFTNSVAAIASAARGLENFYRKRTLEKHTNFAQKALFQGMQDGVISETQAVELAGYADGGLLGAGFGGNKIQRGIVKFNEWGSFMFEMTEQFNRRLVFRAALDLALKNPTAKFVRDSVARNALQYQARRAERWTESEAAAYVTATAAVRETQFEYGKEFAPRVMRGKARSLLVFKTFQQSYFMFLVNNRDARIQSLLIMAFLGGFMGMPFAEELKQLIKILGWSLYGKDWDVAHEARKLILELLGEKNGSMTADLVLHGTAKRGFGIHDVGDMIFGTHNPIPMFDRSKAVGFGGFLPIELDKFFGPPLQTTEKVLAQQGQKAAGAVFGTAFAAYSAMRDTQLSWKDAKRWEAIMPRAIRNVSTAVRGAASGGERTKTGGQIIEYDVRDPQGAAEVIGMGLGYSPYRKSYEWEKAMAKHDAEKMIDIRRTQIMGQFSNAVLGKDPQEKAKMRDAVRDFNRSLEGPEKAKAITSDSLEKSVETKARDRALQARGLPTKTSSVPIYRDVEKKLFPESNRTLRPVKGGLTP